MRVKKRFKFIKQREELRRLRGATDVSRIGFYTSPGWKHLREVYITDNPLCEQCDNKGVIVEANVVDHKIPLTIDNMRTHGLRYDNLQSLCYSCHKTKTNREKSNSKYNVANLMKGEELKNKFESF